MKIIEDAAQKIGQHTVKNNYFKSQGIEVQRFGLPCGDYIKVNDKVDDLVSRKATRGIPIKKMDFLGTYDVSVDTKKDIQELIGDICGKQHERFRDECILAQNNGIQLYVLVENESEYIDTGSEQIFNPKVNEIKDLFRWKNSRAFIMKNSSQVIGTYPSGKPRYKRVRKYPHATKGETLAKACLTMENKYGVKFLFCDPKDSGRIVIELLGGEQ